MDRTVFNFCAKGRHRRRWRAALVCLLLGVAIVVPTAPTAGATLAASTAAPPCEEEHTPQRCAGLWSAACCDYLASRSPSAADIAGAHLTALPTVPSVTAPLTVPAPPPLEVHAPRGHDPTEPTAPFLLGHSVLLC